MLTLSNGRVSKRIDMLTGNELRYLKNGQTVPAENNDDFSANRLAEGSAADRYLAQSLTFRYRRNRKHHLWRKHELSEE